MRVYHFLNAEFGLQDLERRRLKISRINDLNDPFELLGANLSDARFRRAFSDLKSKLHETRGMLCFSQNWRNPVQWSHYADRHRGLCLCFDVPDEHLAPVVYSGKRLAIEAELLKNPNDIDEAFMRRCLTTKYRHWEYEAEVRCFLGLDEADPSSGLYFQDFSDQIKLAQVIAGAASAVSRAQVTTALGNLAGGVEIIKARLAFKSFRVVRQRRKDLW